MKRRLPILAILLICWIVAGNYCVPAQAADTSTVVSYFADGSYLVTTITSNTQSNEFERSTKSGTKQQDYYNSSRELMWTFRVQGTFSYDGRSAKATFADYSYDIYNSAWSFDSASASYSGATATATGTFDFFGVSIPASVSLTCSPKGALS